MGTTPCSLSRARRRRVEIRHIPPEIMELISDVYLSCSGRDPDRPTYTEPYMQRKLRRLASDESGSPVETASTPNELLDSDIAAVLKAAGLTPGQKLAWRLHIIGVTQEEIAGCMGVSHPTAARLIRAAERRVGAFCSRYGGLYSVYSSEMHRPIYHKPGHCSAMHCRRLGYCRNAL